MKLPQTLRTSFRSLRSLVPTNRRGVALITVLTVMALTTLLVLTFFSLATSEHRSSTTYSYGLQAQQVAEQAVNMVIAQIRDATNVGIDKAWASQPGAIRTWDSKGGKDFAFKLYSDDRMKTADWSEFQKDFAEIGTWSSRPDHMVDLNEPVIRGEKVYYPIVHPLASTVPQWPQPFAGDKDGIEGFSYNEKGIKLADQGPFGIEAAKVAKAPFGHLAMPVRWIYQLADGTMGVLADTKSGNGFQFTAITGAGTASAKNPIVARFAFWADDETAKLNLNTHAGGLAWDIPKAGGKLDMDMGQKQPAAHEWQRYPGHPATVHLSVALAPGVIDIVQDRDAMEMLYRVVPRVVEGGSQSGTRIVDTKNPNEANGLIPDTEPLFPSLDDMVMKANREVHSFPDAKGKPLPADDLSDYLERSKFFISVHSRAPETSLFNRPKIAIWPIYHAAQTSAEYKTHLTAFDRLIHMCASIGKSDGTDYDRHDYIFKREKADSSTYDYESIPRNRLLYDYLIDSLGKPFPGYGDSFASKYGDASTRQLATMIFDYIRCTNLHDDTLYAKDFSEAFTKVNDSKHLTFTNARDDAEKGFGHKGHGQVTPLRIKSGGVDTKGMGRFFTVSGAVIHVICAGQPQAVTNIPLYPGVSEYNKGVIESPDGKLYANLPPLPPGVKQDDPAKVNWPDWLKELETVDPHGEFAPAFQESNWNWQLAFLDPAYAAGVSSDPTGNKFNRALITKVGCEEMRLDPDERLLQASFLFDLFSPSIGWTSINPDMEIDIKRESGMKFTADGGSVGFIGFGDDPTFSSGGDTFTWATNWSKPSRQGGGRAWGGLLSFGYTLTASQFNQQGSAATNPRNVWWQMGKDGSSFGDGVRSRLTPLDKGYNQIESALNKVSSKRPVGDDISKIAQSYRYDLVTVPFKIKGEMVNFEGGTVKFSVFSGGEHTEASAPDSDREIVQEITMEFPTFGVPRPTMGPGFGGYVNEFGSLSSDSTGPLQLASLTADPGGTRMSSAQNATRRAGKGRSVQDESIGGLGRMSLLTRRWDSGSTFIRDNDVAQAVCVSHGDMRIPASMPEVTPADKVFLPHRDYGKKPLAHSLTTSVGARISGYSLDKDYLIVPTLAGNNPYNNVVPLAFGAEKSKDVQLYGDFDNGAGTMIDGAYINKPDEGNVGGTNPKFGQPINDIWEAQRNRGGFPYFANPDIPEVGGPAYFSPNRIVSGPGMFGSLPSSLGSSPPKPWQTLLFRPDISGDGFASHPGALSPPDHLILDLFWMPVVEPYAISEPLSTGGKVNLNTQLVPFLHVNRDTAMRGVFRSEMMLCVPVGLHMDYKHAYGRGRGYHWRDKPLGGALEGKRLRSVIVEDKTLEQFATRFGNGLDIFKSATEICEIHLIPQEASERLGNAGSKGSVGSYQPTLAQMQNGKYWRDHALVGDNSRERPYTNIHQRVTTKSNTFMVHYRAQVLKQARRDDDSEYGSWNPELDTVQAEYRGSSIVERYVDPNDAAIIDFADPKNYFKTLDPYFRFRVVNPKRFAP